MKLSFTLLPIISFVLLSACIKPGATCSEERCVKLAAQIILEEAEKSLTKDAEAFKSVLDDALVLDNALILVKATLRKMPITIEGIRTLEKDPNSTKVFCEGLIKISPSVELLKSLKEAGFKISDIAKRESFEQSANSFVKSIEYNVQPTDDGKDFFVEVSAAKSLFGFIDQMLYISILDPIIRNRVIELRQVEESGRQQLDSEKLLNEQKQVQIESALATAKYENALATQTINELWKNYATDDKKLILEAQRDWIKKKEFDCKVGAASNTTDVNEKEIIRLNCDTKATNLRVDELQNTIQT